MALVDNYNEIFPATSIDPDDHTADANGDTVDLQGYESGTVVAHFGDWTDGTHDIVVQESSDDSSWSDVASGDLLGSAIKVDASDEDNTVYKRGYIGSERYIRAKASTSGTTSGAEYGVLVIRGAKRHNV